MRPSNSSGPEDGHAGRGKATRGRPSRKSESLRKSDSISDGAAGPIDGKPAIDSLGRRVRTDVPAHLGQLLPDEAALVYQHIKDRLADILGQGG